MDRHSARPGLPVQAARGRQWSRHFPLLVVIGGSILAACGSSTKEDNTQDPGPPTTLLATSVTTQNASVNGNVAARPTVKVTDADGIAVSGVQVVFAVTSGGGSITGATQTTSALGIATVGSWTMGPAEGANTLTASSDGLTGSPRTFTANATVVASNFTIKLEYTNGSTAQQRAAFENAKARWEAVVVGELSNFTVTNQDVCGTGSAVNETVDDLLIQVVLDSIDGPGQVLGSAGPCIIRGSNSLSIVGQMTFDTADIQARLNDGSFTDIVLHEMGHVLGIGSLWKQPVFNFVSSPCTTNPRYTGAEAIAAYTGTNGGTGTSVPLENFATGGCDNGTRDSHWRETVFGSELMTGFISGTTRPLSLTTVRALDDLGYSVDNGQAEAFTVPNPNGTLRGQALLGPMIDLRNDTRNAPVYMVDDTPGAQFRMTRIQ